ncbi:MFS transporter [Actinoplanes sp. NPDC051851]|uniref:MFS transporter n=1 Tax=Actinoplanes sp. NPDC051851 TaxID=3154753 RepID=UPI003416413D
MTRPHAVLAICCSSVAVVVLDIAAVNVALPSIRRDLHASVAGLQWTVDAYVLVLAGFLVLAGSTADRWGRRRVFQLGLVTFGLGSLLCGLAPGIGWLIAARVVQAVGGTMLNPVAAAIVATAFPDPAARARALGVFSATTGFAQALGPVAGGALIGGFGWHAVFWVNVPITAVAMLCAARYVPESRAARTRRFDPVGQLLIALLLLGTVAALIEGWAFPAVVAGLALAGLLAYEPRRADPLLDPYLFRRPPFRAAMLISLCGMCGFGAFLFVTTRYLQTVRGMSPVAAGVALIPVGLGVALASPLAGRLVAARGARLPLAISGAALAAGGLMSMGRGPGSALPVVLISFLMFGISLGMLIAPITATALSGMPPSMAALATSLPSAARQTGTALGVALAGNPATVWWLTCALGTAILLFSPSVDDRRLVR